MKNEIKLNDLVIVRRGEHCDSVGSVVSFDGNIATVYSSCEAVRTPSSSKMKLPASK
jgi:hypothetical protein